MTDQDAIKIIHEMEKDGSVKFNKKLKEISQKTIINRIKQMDRMVIKLENSFLNTDGSPIMKCGVPFFSTILVPTFIFFYTTRLSKMFLWLKNNYKIPFGDRFPQIPDFQRALKETSDNKIIDTEKYYVNKKYDQKVIDKKWKNTISYVKQLKTIKKIGG